MYARQPPNAVISRGLSQRLGSPNTPITIAPVDIHAGLERFPGELVLPARDLKQVVEFDYSRPVVFHAIGTMPHDYKRNGTTTLVAALSSRKEK